MSEYTYETAPTGALETYEWDNVWWEQTNSSDKGRILYIGDSISCGIREVWNKTEGIEWYDDGCGTSKALDNPYLLPLVLNFAHQQKYRDAILVNNGLHGWHLSSPDYAEYYEKFLSELKKEFPSTPIFIVSTTSLTDSFAEREPIVLERNAAAKAIADRLGFYYIDIYSTSKTLVHTDGVHLEKEGYIALMEKIRAELKAILK